jgi:hypothetical protein
LTIRKENSIIIPLWQNLAKMYSRKGIFFANKNKKGQILPKSQKEKIGGEF